MPECFQEKSEEYDTVLLAIGRTGEAQKLGLAEAGAAWSSDVCGKSMSQ